MVAPQRTRYRREPKVTIASKIRSVIAVVAAAVAVMTVAVPTAPAEAAVGSMSASLSVSNAGNGLRNVQVSGVVSMTRTEALQLIGQGYRVQYRLWGDDPSSDDLRWGPSYASEVLSDPQGLVFSAALQLRSSFLNEDTCWCDDRDEIYAGVRLVSSSGATLRLAESNRALGYY
jgi:hypothetical protein